MDDAGFIFGLFVLGLLAFAVFFISLGVFDWLTA